MPIHCIWHWAFCAGMKPVPASGRATPPLCCFRWRLYEKSANKGYVIRLREEDPQLNITMLEMLKQDFGITVGGLAPLPQDEHGVDLRTVYTTLRRAVMAQPRWDVIEAAFLGHLLLYPVCHVERYAQPGGGSAAQQDCAQPGGRKADMDAAAHAAGRNRG